MTAVDTTSTFDTAAVAAALDRARRRTLGLVDGLSEAEQRAQVSPLMSPFVWDLAHIGNYEELWLLRALDGRAAIDPTLDDLYNAFEHPRWERPSLPILGPDGDPFLPLDGPRRVLDLLAGLDPADLGDEAARLVADGFVYGMVLQHEHQHDETILATHQLRGLDATPPPRSALPTDAAVHDAVDATASTPTSPRRRPLPCRRSTGDPSSWAPRPNRGPTTTSAAPTSSTCLPS